MIDEEKFHLRIFAGLSGAALLLILGFTMGSCSHEEGDGLRGMANLRAFMDQAVALGYGEYTTHLESNWQGPDGFRWKAKPVLVSIEETKP